MVPNGERFNARRRLSIPLVLSLVVTLAFAGAAFAEVETAPLNGVGCQDVRDNADISTMDPSLISGADDWGPFSGACPDIIASGYDFKAAYLWLNGADMYVCLDVFGHPGDMNGDGGYESLLTDCSGVAGDCIDSDGIGGAVVYSAEFVRFAFDRNCDGVNDLVFVLTNDMVEVEQDDFTGLTGPIGGYGVGWEAEPLIPNADDTQAWCDSPETREGAYLLHLPDWGQYFPSNLGLSPLVYSYRIRGGSSVDSYSEDTVSDQLIEANPDIDVEKNTDKRTLCNLGDSTVFTLTVENTGDVPLFNVVLKDSLPEGLAYDATYVPPASDFDHPPAVSGDRFITWTPASEPLDAGDTWTVTFRALTTVDCFGTVEDTAYAEGTTSITCLGDIGDQVTVKDSDYLTVFCVSPCVEVVGPPDRAYCAGVGDTLRFTVSNCSDAPEPITGSYKVGDADPIPFDLGTVDGMTDMPLAVPVYVPLECTTGFDVIVEASATFVDVAGCADSDADTVTITCDTPEVELTKDADPVSLTTAANVSTVTLLVENIGPTGLEEIAVTDELPPGVLFDETQTLGGTCGVNSVLVTDMGTYTLLEFFPTFSLAVDGVCTITYEINCEEFDGNEYPDTARVVAWCEGTFDFGQPVYDWDDAYIVCAPEGDVCPRTIGFWRQQCKQKDNGSNKMPCPEALWGLWRCVIDRTDVLAWHRDDGSADYDSTTVFAALSDSALSVEMCRQLNGPRPMTERDMAELQYLGLMLNLCSSALTEGTLVDGGFAGTVGAAVDSIEAALNAGMNMNHWKTVVDDINNGIGVLGTWCDDSNAIFDDLPGCDDDLAPDFGDITAPSVQDPNIFWSRSTPNPIDGNVTTIHYNIPATAGAVPVTVEVFDLTGRLVRTLYAGTQNPGLQSREWDLRNSSGLRVSSGVYFYRVDISRDVLTKKMLVIQQ